MKSKSKMTSMAKLTAIIVIGIFLILLLSILLGGVILLVLYNTGVMDEISEINFVRSFYILSAVSLVLGTLLTALFSSRLLRPFNDLIEGMQQLSKGRFDTRISMDMPVAKKEFRNISDNFNAMAENLGRVEVLHNDFINDFAHEFKTPIVSVKGFAKILKNKNLSEEERQEYLDIIISEADRLTTLSKNVLTLSKVENRMALYNATEFDVTEQIRNAIIMLQNKWQNKNQELNIELEECRMRGNEELLDLVWINLIDNAIKYTPENGIIYIGLLDKGDSVQFVIKDNGKGISKDVQKRMFDKFYQGDASHSSEGNGIGLTLVSKVVQLHRGIINVESKVSVGTTFIVSLPKGLEVSEEA